MSLGALGSLGNLAGGFASGLDAGSLRRAREAQMARQQLEQQQNDKAVAAAGSAMFSGGMPAGGSAAPPQMAPGQPSQPMSMFQGGTANGSGGTPDPQAVMSYITQGAQQRGLNPLPILATFKGESSFNPGAVGDGGTSGGVAQLHTGGGLGDEYKQKVDPSFDPSHPANNWQKQVDFSLDKIKAGGANGLTPWHAAKNAGIAPGAAMQPGGSQPQGAGQQPQRSNGGLQQAVEAINKANPNASPADKMRALGQLYPYFNKEEQVQLKEQTLQMREQIESMREANQQLIKQFGESHADARASMRDDTQNRGLDIKEKQGDAKLEQATQRLKIATDKVELARKAASRATTRDEFNRKQKIYENAVKEKAAAEKEANQGQNVEKGLAIGGVSRETPEGQQMYGRAGEQQMDGKSKAATAKQDMEKTRPRNEDAPAPEAKADAPPMEGAKKAGDGKWYVQKAGKWFRVDP